MAATQLPRVLLFAGSAAWIGVSLTTVVTAVSQQRLLVWSFVSVLFISAFVWCSRAREPRLAFVALQSACVIAMVALLCNGYEGLLLVLIAAQLALRPDRRLGFAWIAVQSAALGIAIAVHWSISPALLLTPPYLGFQALMFAAVRLFADERRMHEELSNANQALLQLQSELAEKSRVEERLRIAQDLHDSLGHHLTALNLNLELAAHESQEPARTTVRSAQVLARALLHEVKSLVRTFNDAAAVDLQREILRLVQELPHPRLHFSGAPNLDFPDPRIARALLRAVQEIVTNAIRHGEAGNLWIEIVRDNDRVRLAARDDGHVKGTIAEGVGLSGMRRRLEELGGTLTAAPGIAGGFEVRADLPCARTDHDSRASGG